MRTKTFLIMVLLIILAKPTYAQEISTEEAKGIMQEHFISTTEAQKIYPETPNILKIPFSKETLKSNQESWLMPILTKRGYKYLLLTANFDNEIATTKFQQEHDTLSLAETKFAIKILSETRINFLERANSGYSFQYFFRTKTLAPKKQGINFKKAVAYDDNQFLVLDWPNDVELGVVNKDYISYLTRNDKGQEIKLGLAFLPENHPPLSYLESIYVLTMFVKK